MIMMNGYVLTVKLGIQLIEILVKILTVLFIGIKGEIGKKDLLHN